MFDFLCQARFPYPLIRCMCAAPCSTSHATSPPPRQVHGSFSLNANFDALRRVFAGRGAACFHSTQGAVGIATFAFADVLYGVSRLPPPTRQPQLLPHPPDPLPSAAETPFPHVATAFSESVEHFGPGHLGLMYE